LLLLTEQSLFFSTVIEFVTLAGACRFSALLKISVLLQLNLRMLRIIIKVQTAIQSDSAEKFDITRR
jgi:hypothetical protein